MLYHVWGSLDFDFDDIEADSESEAFIIASDAAMQGGGEWSWTIIPVEGEDD